MIDPVLKRSLGQMIKGVEVVGAHHDGVSRAFCSHWVTQVSFEEPIVMSSVSPKHDTYPLMVGSGRFSVSILAGEEELHVHRVRRLVPAARALAAAGPGGRPAFTALFAANDLMAMAAVSALGELGIRVPQDVSVIGYDDSRFAGYTSPPLTTVHVPIDAVSASACRLLLNACYDSELPVERSFPSTVAWRGSVIHGPHPPLCTRP